jgi:hypothetical protein
VGGGGGGGEYYGFLIFFLNFENKEPKSTLNYGTRSNFSKKIMAHDQNIDHIV